MVAVDSDEPTRNRGLKTVQSALDDRYVVERELGRGGMAIVYLAQDRKHERPVAIKVLHTELAADISVDRFLFEIRVAAGLIHPNILPLYDSGRAGNAPYYVMPYVDGESLRDRLRRERRLPLTAALRLTREIADGLDYAHRRGLVHRDIKPENILLVDGHAVIADFGIAVALQHEREERGERKRITLGGQVVGTPAYMSPEQALGNTVDGRSDIYSLACVLTEMLVGEPPFQDESEQEILSRQVHGAPERPSLKRPELPPALDALVLKALEKNPRKRFVTIAEFGVRVSSLMTDMPAAAFPPSRGSLPSTRTTLIGREREVGAGRAMLERDGVVTILGPGGVGKSRLAIAIARGLEETGDDVMYVSLTGLASSDLLVARIGEALGLTLVVSGDPLRQLGEYLREQRLTLVLDNFDDVVEAAPILSTLRAAAPAVRILVTSRERLNISDEAVLELRGLPPGTDAQSDVVQLFTSRARQHDPDFQLTPDSLPLVIEICRRVGGSPLGIELAASMLRVLTARELAAELDRTLDAVVTPLRDFPDRHRSLPALFDSSWVRLSPREQQALMRLSILRGPFRRETAEAAGAASLPLLLQLVDKSLIQRATPGRYQIHEVIRRCAESKLRDDPNVLRETQVARLDHFAEFLEERNDRLCAGDQHAAAEEVAAEMDDIRAAWAYAVETRDERNIARSIDSLARFYAMKSWWVEAAQVFDLPRGMSIVCYADAARASALIMLGRTAEARSLLRTAFRGLRDAGAFQTMLRWATAVGATTYYHGRPAVGKRYLQYAIAQARSRGSRVDLGRLLNGLAVALMGLGENAAADAAFDESIRIGREIGDLWSCVLSLANWSDANVTLGQLADARAHAAEARRLAIILEHRTPLAVATATLAEVAIKEGDFGEASRMAEDALTLSTEAGIPEARGSALELLARSAVGQGRAADAVGYFEQALGILIENRSGPQVMRVCISVATFLESVGARDAAVEILANVVSDPTTYSDERSRAAASLQKMGGTAPPGVSADTLTVGRRAQELLRTRAR